jgi:hypothetical protein
MTFFNPDWNDLPQALHSLIGKNIEGDVLLTDHGPLVVALNGEVTRIDVGPSNKTIAITIGDHAIVSLRSELFNGARKDSDTEIVIWQGQARINIHAVMPVDS